MKKQLKNILYRLRGDYTTEKLVSMGMRIGKNFKRLHGVILDPGHCWLICIGNNVTLAPRVHVLCHDASTKQHLNYTKLGRVTIGDNVFIGASAVILPGVSIGNDVIVGANSTVTQDIPSGMVFAGCPAKLVCSTEDYLTKERVRMETAPCYDENYTLGGNISSEQKQQQRDELKNSNGYVV
ncbi:hypothetical protein OAF62_00800 [Akkermansiaceae bacterium]|nr:hypothetical protein [Akkermansiaceae bacterium]